MEKNNINKITHGVIWKQLLLFFFPIFIGTLFQQLYNTVDAIIVGRFIGKEALASVGGSPFVITSLIIGFFTGLSAGAVVVISQNYGAKDYVKLHKGLHTAYAICIITGLVITVLGWFLTPWMLRITKTQANVIESATVYLRIYFLGLLSLLIFNMGSSIMRAIGDSKRPLYYLIISCVINIVLDLLFVVVFKMGVMGAAVATVIAQVISAFLVTKSLMSDYPDMKLKLKDIKIDKLKLKKEFKIGFPSGLQACMYGITNIIIQTAVNGFGTDTTAAWAAYGKLDAIFWTVCTAFSVSITTFVGQNYGAGNLKRAFKSLRVCIAMSLSVGGFIVIMLFIFVRPLFALFTTDEKVVEIGVFMLRYLAPSYLIYVFVEIYTGALRGMGNVFIPTLITLGGVICVRIPWVLLVVPNFHEITTVMLSYPIAWIITVALLIPYYYIYKRKLIRKSKKEL